MISDFWGQRTENFRVASTDEIAAHVFTFSPKREERPHFPALFVSGWNNTTAFWPLGCGEK